MESPSHFEERRKYPRLVIELPLEYSMMYDPHVHGGLAVNASEMGLLIYSIGDIPIGKKLKLSVLFPKGYELANFEVFAQIIWKSPHGERGWEGYKYGLKFIQISEGDYWKLKQLLSGQFKLEEISPVDKLHEGMAIGF